MTEENNEAKVGYSNPPKDTRWKPGQSGNPSGRPPNKKYLSEIARELLEEVPRGEVEGRNADILVVLALIRKALGGDTRAIEMLHDWTEGRVKDKLDVTETQKIEYVPAKGKDE